MNSAPFKLVGGMLIFLFAIVVFFSTYFTVGPFERVVVTNFGKIEYVADPGLHFKTPFTQSTHTFQTSVQDVFPQAAVNTYTVDNQEVDVLFHVFYRIPVAQVEFVYTNIPDVQDRLYSMTLDRLERRHG